MRVNWNQLIAKILVWLAAEIVLNLVGLDNLADYSEFAHTLKEPSTSFSSVLIFLPSILPLQQEQNDCFGTALYSSLS